MFIRQNKLTKQWEVISDLYHSVLAAFDKKGDAMAYKKKHITKGYGYGYTHI
jgi:hypothetical protein